MEFKDPKLVSLWGRKNRREEEEEEEKKKRRDEEGGVQEDFKVWNY